MINQSISIVTTFHKAGLDKYAQKMLDSFAETWPKESTLYAYAEDCTPVVTAPNIIVKDLHASSPELVAFKKKWKDVPKANGDVSQDPVRSLRKDAGKGFKWDAVRFAHKVYSIFHCATICNTDKLMWMDADTICHSPIDMKRINEILLPAYDLCYVGRDNKWPECGLYSINLRNKMAQTFLKEFQRVYDEAENGIFQMSEWHDSFVFEEVRKKLNLHCLNWGQGIIRGEGHPLINSVWGAYLDHLKGGRKALGKSKASDLRITRTEEYWKDSHQWSEK